MHPEAKRRIVDPQSPLKVGDVKDIIKREVKVYKVKKNEGDKSGEGEETTEVVDKFLSASVSINLQSVGSKLRERREAEAEKRRKLWEERGGSEEADLEA